MNKIFLVGSISSIKEYGVKFDVDYINFNLAVKKTRKLRIGENNAYFFKCAAYSNTAKYLKEYGKVGRLLTATGYLDVSTTNTSGEWVTNYQIIIEEINFLDKGRSSKEDENKTLELLR